jgi:hypothetical protein
LPEPGDNVAIVRKVVAKGTLILLPPALGGHELTLDHQLLEGHRFAVKAIQTGEPLLSWGLMFGRCSRPIAPGNYVANERMLTSLRGRDIRDLPASPNFSDEITSHVIDVNKFKPALQLPRSPDQQFFEGFCLWWMGHSDMHLL